MDQPQALVFSWFSETLLGLCRYAGFESSLDPSAAFVGLEAKHHFPFTACLEVIEVVLEDIAGD